MTDKKHFYLILLLTLGFSASSSYAAPNSYADLIADERQKMAENHPNEQHQHTRQMVKQESLNPLPTTWIQAIQTEHLRMKQALPDENQTDSD